MPREYIIFIPWVTNTSCHFVEFILVKGPCTSLYQFVLQLLSFLSQLLQLLFLGLNLFVSQCCHNDCY